jgi:hypothetical protein
MLPSLAVLAGGGLLFGVAAWLAGLHPHAHPEPDLVRAPVPESIAVGIAYVGIAAGLFGNGAIGYRLAQVGLAGWAIGDPRPVSPERSRLAGPHLAAVPGAVLAAPEAASPDVVPLVLATLPAASSSSSSSSRIDGPPEALTGRATSRP